MINLGSKRHFTFLKEIIVFIFLEICHSIKVNDLEAAKLNLKRESNMEYFLAK